MQIDLAQALRQAADQAAETFFASFVRTKAVRRPDRARAARRRDSGGAEDARKARQQCRAPARAFHVSQYVPRLDGHARRTQTKSSANRGDQRHRRPDADENVCARCNGRGCKPVARNASNCAVISAATWARASRRMTITVPSAAISERNTPLPSTQMAKRRCGQHRPAFHQHHMQADTQSRHAPRARNGIRCRRRRDHQARGRENTAAMRRFDGLVDFARRAEVIRRDDQSLQAVSCRVRRK